MITTAGVTAEPAVVVVGASLAGLRVAQALRRHGYAGPLTLLGAEEYLPYDRPPLSKQVLSGDWEPDRTALTTSQELAGSDIGLRLGVAAVGADETAVRLADGSAVPYTHLVAATGATARTWPGSEPGRRVHRLRTLDDAVRLRDALTAEPAASVAVVGGGFIGLEVAAAARKRLHEVCVIEQAAAPLEPVLGPLLGSAFARLHAEQGVALRTGLATTAIEEGDDRVAVRLIDSTVVDADHVVVGIGAGPATAWLAGLGLDRPTGVPCDARGRAADRVWALGDVARWSSASFGDAARHEHWTSALDQAAVVAADLLGREPDRPDELSYFWSTQYDVNLQMCGRPDLADDVEILEPATDEVGRGLVVAYRRVGRTVAVAAFHDPRRFLRLRRELQQELTARPLEAAVDG